MNYESLLIITTVLYLSQIGFFLVGLARTRQRGVSREQPFVSVIIAARNEEAVIGECVASVLKQTYPPDRYEVIVVDDESEDGTRAAIERASGPAGIVRVISSQPSSALRGKTNALATGIRVSRGEVILITDADCTVPPGWIEETVKEYEPGVGIVGGMTLQRADNRFGGMQSLDWAYLLGIASAAVGLRNPLSTIGNNLSFLRKAYDQVGGYEGIPFSVTEDYSLFQAIIRTGSWKVRYPLDAGLLVTSRPCRTWRDLLRQKHRWGKGGLDMKPSGYLIMAIGFLQHLMILGGPVLYGAITAALTAWLVKAIGDYVFLHTVLRRLDKADHLGFFLPFQAYYLLYVLVLPFVVFLRPTVVWKGRSY